MFFSRQKKERSPLWKHPDFLRLWTAQSSAQFGAQITLLAVPIVAAITLDISARAMGLLTAAGTLPFLLIGLFAGVVVDRSRRRPILVWTCIGRAVVLAAIPLASLLDRLSLEVLFVVTFIVGVQTVFFEVAYQSYLPTLIERRFLVDGNSKLEASRAGAQILGPGIAGGLIQLLTAPFAIILNTVAFLFSGLLLNRIQSNEPEPQRRGDAQSVRRDIAEGIAFIIRHRYLRPITACTGTSNFFSAMYTATFVLFATRHLGLSPGLIGIIFGAGSAGFMLGALVASNVAERIGLGRAILGGVLITPLGLGLVAVASGPKIVTVPTLIAAVFLISSGGAIYNINQLSLRQAITPDHLLGRMNATIRFLVWGTLPLGGIAGGFVAEALGLRFTLGLAAVGGMLAVLWIVFSDVRALREQPEQVEEEPVPIAA